jgi:DNA primase
VVILKAKEFKDILDDDRIALIMESIGCHHIKKKFNCVTAALPDGDNESSVCCYTDNEIYHVDVHTRSAFQCIKNRDILTLIGFIKGISFPQALKFACSLFDLDYYYDHDSEVPKFLTWLDFVETGEMKESDTSITPLPEIILDQFFMGASERFLNEGVSVEAQNHFEIGCDIDTERIIIPIRSELGDLCGVKGRLIKDSKLDGNKYKYMYIYGVSKTRMIYGLFQNHADIVKSGEIIVLESEKSVVKLWGLGYKNAVAICGKSISETQAELILRCNVDIVLAFDKDVQEEEIEANMERLNYPVKTQKVFVLQDPLNLLTEKESPCDCADTWKCLYENFKIEI